MAVATVPSAGGATLRDHSLDLPDDCLALVFHSLGAGDRNRCSLVCRRWMAVEARSRHRLVLHAHATLLEAAPALLSRFDAVSRLSLRCDRRSDSIGDDALDLIARHCFALSRLKLRACHRVTDLGMSSLAANCPSLRRLSCASCSFGRAGIEAVLRGCPLLEDLSVKRLGGLANATPAAPLAASSFALRWIRLKELYNAQCFASLIAGSPSLRSLKVVRCSGNWDLLLEEIASRLPSIVEVHLEKLQVSDRGLLALSCCLALEVLHLVKTPECTDAGVVAIADKCRRLRKIHIDGCRRTKMIGDYGLVAIARGCPELQELVLIGINPTALSMENIASRCHGLERLALCGCDTIGDAEIACIAAKCMSLKKLCIKECPVSDSGLEALAEGCPNLMKVKLKRCHRVTPEGVKRLMLGRGRSLALSVDAVEIQVPVVATLTDRIVTLNLPSSINDRPAPSRSRVRSFLASAFPVRKW